MFVCSDQPSLHPYLTSSIVSRKHKNNINKTDSNLKTMIQFSELDTTKSCEGLVPAIIQDDNTMQVLMLGYMNAEAYEKTVATGKVTFYSRTRQCLWTKGETSGNFLTVKSIAKDCDSDTLLIRAIPAGPVCHTGSKTCFNGRETEGFIKELQSVIQGRHKEMPDGSYNCPEGGRRGG